MRGREHRNMLCDVFKYLLQSVPLPSVRHFPNVRKCLSRNPVGTAVYFSGSGKERKMALGNSLACFDGADRLLSRRHPKASGQQHVPNYILSKRQDSFCENRANGRGAKTERKCANLTRPRECRMKAGSRFPRHFAVRHGTPCGRNSPLVSAPRGEWLAKRTNGVCTRADFIWDGKSLPKPSFSLLPAPAVTALRQKSFVFAESGSLLCGKRFCFYRGKATAGAEKCSIQTVPPSVF